MSWEYCCPKCKTMLNPTKKIILCAAHGETRVMIGLHPQPGKYAVYLPPGVKAEDGQAWEFSCPMCHESLQTAPNSNFCELELILEGQPLRILFSRIAGEHATFVINKDKGREGLGEDQQKYDSQWSQGKTIL